MSSFGLDIGANSIKAVQLKPEKGRYRLLAFGMTSLPASLQSESSADQKAIAEAIKKLLLDIGITVKRAVLALPESQVFSRVIEVPPLSEAELKSAIKWEAEQYIPIPIEEANLDYQIIRTPPKGATGKKMEVFLVAAPKNFVEKYLRILKIADLQPLALETELISICRALVGQAKEEKHNLVINIGSLSSDLAITRGDQIVHTRSIPTGGNALARAVARDLDLEVSQAEEYKKSYGLGEKQLEGKVKAAIKPIFDVVINEIKKAIIFYQEKEKVKLENVLLSGGTAKLPGVVPYLANSLGIGVQIGDPLTNVICEETQKTELVDDAPFYTTAVGLAMKKV